MTDPGVTVSARERLADALYEFGAAAGAIAVGASDAAMRDRADDIAGLLTTSAATSKAVRPHDSAVPVHPEGDVRERLAGSDMIAEERRRQVEAEGYDASHDDEHDHGELAMAAVCYAADAAGYEVKGHVPTVIYGDERCGCREADCPHRWIIPGTEMQWRDPWPWEDGDKRARHDRIRKLVIAGAWIAAEIDRIQRSTTDSAVPPEASTEAVEERTADEWGMWAYRQGLKLDGVVPLLNLTNSQRIERAIDLLASGQTPVTREPDSVIWERAEAAARDTPFDRIASGEVPTAEAVRIMACHFGTPPARRAQAPSEPSEPCRIHEHDGAFKCYTHDRMWGAVSNPDEPCDPTPTRETADTEADDGAREAFVEAGWRYLHAIAGGGVCEDASCHRCRTASVVSEAERDFAAGPPNDSVAP